MRVAELVKLVVIVDDDFSPIDLDHPFFLQATEGPADSFNGEPEEVTDVHT